MKWFIGIAVSLIVAFSLTFVLAEAFGLTDQRLVTAWFESMRGGHGGSWFIALVIFGLLSGDLILPIPSSVVMTLSGYMLGFPAGAAVTFAGAMASAMLGFGLCRVFGRKAFVRLVGAKDESRIERFMSRYGEWGIILSRSVPMLTEVVSCLAGLSEIGFLRFVLLSACGALPICVVYAWAGATSGGVPAGIGWAVLLAFVIPAAGFAIVRLLTRK
ncbi:MAG: VTT domain-containing protein [bacterium]